MRENELLQYIEVGLPEDILREKLCGNFADAVRLIDRRLREKDLPEALRRCLLAEREMMQRLPQDFPFTKEQALEKIRAHIPDFTEAEWQEQLAVGQIRRIYRNGEMRIFDRFFESMCKSMPEFAARAAFGLAGGESAGRGSAGERRLNRAIKIMKETGSLACRIRIRASVRVNDAAFVPGSFVRVHLPIPAACERQSDIVIESVHPENAVIAPENAPQRTVCWEEILQKNHEFWVEYSYTSIARWRDTEAEQSSTALEDRERPGAECLAEQAPHIRFTPYIRALVKTLCAGTDADLEKARRFYDFITLRCKYTYMPSYFSLEEIAENCARTFTGDCGVFALLFITLCRCAGIPAQWQSGFAAEPDFIGGHDWARFYAEPFGWLYADPSYGIGAVRCENEERRQFYFGNIDPYRMTANNAFQAEFTPPKSFWRTDPYDNQLGEIETGERGLRYEEYTRKKEILECRELF